ncbi:MAG: NAD(P)-dependent oxidoreductase [Woeseiaceae bacterium]|nr:NAD(P)-dependent oxidoreductase [Woeseiaceae bacterium]
MSAGRPTRAAFVGLGVMGYPMAGHLARAGVETTVFNRTTSRAEDWCREYDGKRVDTPAEAASDADVVLVCVGNDDDVREVTAGPDGVFAGMRQDAILVDHTTASATLAHELAAAATEREAGFLDAPVSGGQAGAENGQLSVMVGGQQAHFDAARPVMDCYAKAVTLIGDTGSGQLAKMVNQICIAGVVQGLAEGLAFAQRAGLDPALLIEAIGKGAAQSWQMDNRWQTMIDGEFDFGFAVDWMRKDLAIALDEAECLGIDLDMTRLVDGYYADVQAMGGNRWDTSSLIARLKPPSDAAGDD